MVSWKDFRKAFRQAMIGPAGPGLSPEVETFDIGQNIAEGNNDAAAKAAKEWSAKNKEGEGWEFTGEWRSEGGSVLCTFTRSGSTDGGETMCDLDGKETGIYEAVAMVELQEIFLALLEINEMHSARQRVDGADAERLDAARFNSASSSRLRQSEPEENSEQSPTQSPTLLEQNLLPSPDMLSPGTSLQSATVNRWRRENKNAPERFALLQQSLPPDFFKSWLKQEKSGEDDDQRDGTSKWTRWFEGCIGLKGEPGSKAERQLHRVLHRVSVIERLLEDTTNGHLAAMDRMLIETVPPPFNGGAVPAARVIFWQ